MQPALYECPSLRTFRRISPLIHCMTNDVVQGFTANILLATGGSPAMVIEPQEAEEFAALASALLINVGTLTTERAQAMRGAVLTANRSATPWVLDPVAVGALSFRRDFCQELLTLHPAAIRGNASEIMTLAGVGLGGRGVDSTDSWQQALPAAQALARQTGAIVAVSGERDVITDGTDTHFIDGGSILMTRVVGTGCGLSALVTGFCALPGDKLSHVAAACRIMKYAGGISARDYQGLGTFACRLIDILSQMEIANEAD